MRRPQFIVDRDAADPNSCSRLWTPGCKQVSGRRLKANSRQHLTPEEIAAFVNPKMSVQDSELIIKHLSNCPHCRRLVSEVVLSRTATKDPGADLS